MARIFYRKTEVGTEPTLIDADDYEYIGDTIHDEPAIIVRKLGPAGDNWRHLAVGDLILASDGLWMCCKIGWQHVGTFFVKNTYDLLLRQLMGAIDIYRIIPNKTSN